MICFSCEELGHIAARCPNREDKDEKKHNKYKCKKDLKNCKDYKDKGMKYCFMAKDSNSSDDDEMVYIDVKDEYDDEEGKMVLISHVSKNDTWIIDSGCPHYMTGDKIKFEQLEHCDGRSVRFENNEPCYVKGKGFIALNEGSNVTMPTRLKD